MRVTKQHNTTKEQAKHRIQALLPQLLTEFGPNVSDPTHSWVADVMKFSFRSHGFSITGQLAVNETEVVLDVGIPFLARLIEGRLRSQAEERLAEYFPG